MIAKFQAQKNYHKRDTYDTRREQHNALLWAIHRIPEEAKTL